VLAAAYGLALRGVAPSALRLPPHVRHVAGGQDGRPTAYLPTPQPIACGRSSGIKGSAAPEMLTRSVLGLRPALRVRLPLSPLTPLPLLNGKRVKI